MNDMTGTEAALLKVGISALSRTVPTGLAYLKTWWKGKKIMIVGQSRSGKTTFIDYLQHGLFEDEKDTFKTQEITGSAKFNVKMGRDSTLELTVKSVVDVPGQIGPTAHANEVIKNNPDAIIILTDLTAPLNGSADRAAAAWLREFCKRLEAETRTKSKKNRLKSVIVVLNKKDKVKDTVINKRKQEFCKIMDAELHNARGQMSEDIAILPTILVTNADGTKYIDSVIAHLAKNLAR